ncbi:MAG: carbohydrate ABC transporter permease [Spirochaetales bacterium]|nr:carbohydrate ABC transporter permease [Spirochaetales bacterium]
MMKNRLIRILCSLVMAVLAIAFCTPFLILLVNSLKTNPEISRNPFNVPVIPTLSHFTKVWRSMDFPEVLLRTVLITCGSVAGIVLIASMAAYALRKTRVLFSRLLFPFFVFLLLIPFPSIMFPLVLLAGNLGLNNVAGVIPIYWGLGCPLAVLVFHGFIKGIPGDCEEAAALDGAGGFRIFFTIVLPVLKPAVVMVIILNVFHIWNDFLLPLVILPPYTTLQLAQFGFFIQSRGTWGPAAASLVLSSLPILIFFIVIQKQIVKSIYAGAIKGE